LTSQEKAIGGSGWTCKRLRVSATDSGRADGEHGKRRESWFGRSADRPSGDVAGDPPLQGAAEGGGSPIPAARDPDEARSRGYGAGGLGRGAHLAAGAVAARSSEAVAGPGAARALALR